MLWRHGRTAWNREGRFQGQLDVPLDEVGVEQAGRAARLLTGLRPDRIVASDLGRAADTAAALAAVTGLPVETDVGLRETHGGAWQGLTGPEILAADGTTWRAWRHGDDDVRPGGSGETRVEVARRAEAAVRRALESLPAGGTLVAVTHGGAARVAIASLLGLPGASWAALGGLSNCCWSVLAEDPEAGRWRLLEHNAGSLPQPVLTEEG